MDGEHCTASVRISQGSVRGRPAADLRRSLGERELDRLRLRLEHLPARERALLTAMFIDGHGACEIAPLMGISARTVRRRIRRSAARVLSELFGFVLRERERWTPLRRRVAVLSVVEGLPTREVARQAGVTLHVVRRELLALRAQHAAERRYAGRGAA